MAKKKKKVRRNPLNGRQLKGHVGAENPLNNKKISSFEMDLLFLGEDYE